VDPAPHRALTAAEHEVAYGLWLGRSYEQIARERGTSVRTVANQVRAAFRKLRINSRAELCAALHAVFGQPHRESAAPRASLAALSPREHVVLARRARGDSLKAIAYDLAVSTSTICRDLQRAMAELGLVTPGELARALPGFAEQRDRHDGVDRFADDLGAGGAYARARVEGLFDLARCHGSPVGSMEAGDLSRRSWRDCNA